MTRGNQREKAREKNLKDGAGAAKKNTQSGSEQARNKDAVAAIMQAKQAKAAEKKAAEGDAKAGGKKK